MRMLLVVIVVAAACGKGSSKAEVEACNRMAKLCGEQVTPGELQECASAWPEFRKQFGEDTAQRYLTCTRDAKSCPEILGCATGIFGKFGKDFERGMNKMITDDDKDAPPVDDKDMPTLDDDDGPLPPECARANDVCAKDEPFARDKCRDMVGNIKSDPANLKELTDCYAASKNCFEFKKCSTDMWFKLN